MASPIELHVWGPAFGLPSIDAESLAVILLARQSLSSEDYRLVQDSPSNVPTRALPALYDPTRGAWRSGFSTIALYLRQHPRPSYEDPDAHLDDSQRADAAAYNSYLTTHAGPLLALSLYVSSTNWTGATRPAYSKILPFPLAWTEPLAVRTAMDRRAEHLGMSSLDADAEAEKESETEKAAAAAGWIQVPKSLRTPKPSITGLMTPEQKARIRLDGLAAEVLDVLDEWEVRQFPTNADGALATVKCLEFAYLALMLVPDVPRPWLRDNMLHKYLSLCAFVRDTQEKNLAVSPWVTERQAKPAVLNISARFGTDVLYGLPGVGEMIRRWWLQPRTRLQDAVIGFGVGLCLITVSTSALYWRRLPPLGSPLFRWERARKGLGAFGAAGAMFTMPSLGDNGSSFVSEI